MDLALNNDVSAKRSAQLLRNAAVAGAAHVDDLAAVPLSTNAARDLLRKAFRNTKWPATYDFHVRAANVEQNAVTWKKISMLLPHELLHAVLKVNAPECLLQCQEEALRLRPDLQQQTRALQSTLGLDPQKTLLLGIWIDAVPFNSDRSQSLETLTMSILGQKDMRFPLVCFPKALQAKGQTYEDIFEVLAWSMRILLRGQMPSCRHNGEVWAAQDSYRRRLTGNLLPCKAALVELRGDWSMYKEVLDFPSWSSKGFICWRCSCTREHLKSFTSEAPYRPLGCTHIVFRDFAGYRTCLCSPRVQTYRCAGTRLCPQWTSSCASEGRTSSSPSFLDVLASLCSAARWTFCIVVTWG